MTTKQRLKDFLANPTPVGFDTLREDSLSLLSIYKESEKELLPFFNFEDWELICSNSKKSEREKIIEKMRLVAKEFSHWVYIYQFGVTKEQKAFALKQMNDGDWDDTSYF
jgi:hypothetical protein